MSETVIYQPFDGNDGLQVIDDQLIAWREGQEVARTEISTDEDLPRLLLDFRVPELMSELEFTLVPEARQIDLEIDMKYQIGSALTGTITYDGVSGPWEARCVKGADFIEAELPEGARPWARDEEPGVGWEITLPPEFSRSPDTVLAQRVALAIEAFLYALTDGREISLPYLRRVSNVFSASAPTWRDPVPMVRPAETV
jgi:hypothetical protein